ncbi:DNA polymerase III subunit delta [Leptolyngbya sp. AN10]|uniref:DNA polymerase III subunit delta n=1 Tax=Leptolyngbya sp. AN10 TaxID=3423365 RepID=UPI003D31B328
MPILTLLGDDSHGIAQFVKALKAKLKPEFEAFNFHTYAPCELTSALTEARTPPMGDFLRIIVIENCLLSSAQQFNDDQVEQLEIIQQIPSSTTLVFIANSIDKRLKAAKLLIKHGKIQEFKLVDPWKANNINQSIRKEADRLQIQLSPEQFDYLTTAVGNNTARAYQQLLKLKLYSEGSSLTMEALRSLVPCQTQTSLQLADAIRQGKSGEVAILLDCLLQQSQFPSVITATLCTQFRTWVWIKSTLDKGIQDNQKIAQLCSIANPNRVYYLRQEVADVSACNLSQGLTMLFELDIALKQGLSHAAILPRLIAVSQVMKLTSPAVAR